MDINLFMAMYFNMKITQTDNQILTSGSKNYASSDYYSINLYLHRKIKSIKNSQSKALK